MQLSTFERSLPQTFRYGRLRLPATHDLSPPPVNARVWAPGPLPPAITPLAGVTQTRSLGSTTEPPPAGLSDAGGTGARPAWQPPEGPGLPASHGAEPTDRHSAVVRLA